ncbi:MAG: hypothetical protein L0210_07130, partial [Rhodospirillales bacterium]|nr:hypothetical protein [Rhodospirillales bacterium]
MHDSLAARWHSAAKAALIEKESTFPRTRALFAFCRHGGRGTRQSCFGGGYARQIECASDCTTSLPDAELDDFVDAHAIWIASLDQAMTNTKPL